MTPFLLYHPKTRPTGRALAKLLGISFGTILQKKHANISHIIRWGNIREVSATYDQMLVGRDTIYLGHTKRNRTEINTRQAVTLAGSKFRALQALQAAGIPVPRFWRRAAKGDGETIPSGLTILGRDFRHSQGTDIVICDADTERPNESDYLVEYIKPHKEYRVHVMGGEILFAQRKYFRGELWEQLSHKFQSWDGSDAFDKFRERSQIVRNNDHGWGFHDMNDLNGVPEAVRMASIGAVKALGLDFGAVDAISTEKDKNGKRGAFVLEVNSAPGLRDRNLEKYADGLSKLLRGK